MPTVSEVLMDKSTAYRSFFEDDPRPLCIPRKRSGQPPVPLRSTSLTASLRPQERALPDHYPLTPPSTPPSSDLEDGDSSEGWQVSAITAGSAHGDALPVTPVSPPSDDGSQDSPVLPSLKRRLTSPIRRLSCSHDSMESLERRGCTHEREKFKKQRRCFSACTRLQHPAQTPDRFIPIRDPDSRAAELFRSTKPVQDLTWREKLLRSPEAADDPFQVPNSPRDKRRTDRFFSDGIATQRAGYVPERFASPSGLLDPFRDVSSAPLRKPSSGAVWNVGGPLAPATSRQGPPCGIPNGRGGRTVSGSNAPYYIAAFANEKPSDHPGMERQDARVAKALGINTAGRILSTINPLQVGTQQGNSPYGSRIRNINNAQYTTWQHGQWVSPDGRTACPIQSGSEENPLPATPFRVLDAPNLRDDYYCSIIAYCETTDTLAVALGGQVYCWRESLGIRVPYTRDSEHWRTYITSLSFSSTSGGHAILAIGRADATFGLWSLHDKEIRWNVRQPNPIASVSFKPVTTMKHSSHFDMDVKMEELLVGDDAGFVYYYAVEWMSDNSAAIHGYDGEITRLFVIGAHTQQICGLVWSPDGEFFVSGGNDNDCHLFCVQSISASGSLDLKPTIARPAALRKLVNDLRLSTSPASPSFLTPPVTPSQNSPKSLFYTSLSTVSVQSTPPLQFLTANSPHRRSHLRYVTRSAVLHTFPHSAAVKAMAFCPWQRGLLATGGGSNDRSINFWHTFSGARLATIDTAAQVTGLVWSLTRREIAATFGYAQPEHGVRIAVFGWPDCALKGKVVWQGEGRALGVVRYPGGPSSSPKRDGKGGVYDEDGERTRDRDTARKGGGKEGSAGERTMIEGCIVVAGSDESVKFHEVWTGKAGNGTEGGMIKSGFGGRGVLEGSLADDRGWDMIR